jgi:dienelactone hydrolase
MKTRVLSRVLLTASMLLISATSVNAKVVTKVVPYQDKTTQLEGFLAYDSSIRGKRPGILVVHEWWGLNDYARRRAEQLAALGYVAFALDMYGKGMVTVHPKEASQWSQAVQSNVQAWQERAQAGLDVLKKEPLVDTNRIAAIGYCFGGSTVQELAYSGADLRGVVSFHGSLMIPAEDQAKQVKAKILICHGAADPFTKPDKIPPYIEAMDKYGLDWRMIIYGGAEHGFTNPDADKMGVEGLKYDKSADLQSWQAMKDFFQEIFAPR